MASLPTLERAARRHYGFSGFIVSPAAAAGERCRSAAEARAVATDGGTLIGLRQPGGRSLWCWNYIVSYTYNGFSIRTPSEDCNAHMLDSVRREAARLYGDQWPVHIVPPSRQPGEIDYPRVRVTAFFTSLPMRDEMHLSSLVVVWFQREQALVPDEAGRVALEGLDWERLALDYET